ncbi:MAG: tetratricopeptide repeat protein [Candidatus Shapirobacteria bacterium]|nr:tetratricopeptide repeat protein [Candidatus Shapirobacteria bacterium]
MDSEYNQEALKSLIRASELAPTDAKIAYNLGVLYAKLGQEETAIQVLEKTIELKPNYDQARYALGLFYEKKGEISKAKEQYQYILDKINSNDELAIEKLKKLK